MPFLGITFDWADTHYQKDYERLTETSETFCLHSDEPKLAQTDRQKNRNLGRYLS